MSAPSCVLDRPAGEAGASTTGGAGLRWPPRFEFTASDLDDLGAFLVPILRRDDYDHRASYRLCESHDQLGSDAAIWQDVRWTAGAAAGTDEAMVAAYIAWAVDRYGAGKDGAIFDAARDLAEVGAWWVQGDRYHFNAPNAVPAALAAFGHAIADRDAPPYCGFGHQCRNGMWISGDQVADFGEDGDGDARHAECVAYYSAHAPRAAAEMLAELIGRAGSLAGCDDQPDAADVWRGHYGVLFDLVQEVADLMRDALVRPIPHRGDLPGGWLDADDVLTALAARFPAPTSGKVA